MKTTNRIGFCVVNSIEKSFDNVLTRFSLGQETYIEIKYYSIEMWCKIIHSVLWMIWYEVILQYYSTKKKTLKTWLSTYYMNCNLYSTTNANVCIPQCGSWQIKISKSIQWPTDSMNANPCFRFIMLFSYAFISCHRKKKFLDTVLRNEQRDEWFHSNAIYILS